MSQNDGDFLVFARWIIPVVPANTCLEDHAIVVENGRIKALTTQREAVRTCPGYAIVHLDQHIVTPGLVNAHGHAAMTLLRGYADDRELMDWLNNHMWPVEGKFVDYDFTYDGTVLAIAEMLRTGTTCAADTYFFPDASAKAYIDHHFRAQVGLPVIQFPNAWARSETEHIDKALALHRALRNEPLVTTAFAPHAPYTVTDDAFRKIVDHSETLAIPIHLHLHETATEVSDSMKEHGMRPFARLSSLGLLSTRLQTIHMTQLEPGEIDALAASGAHVAHCPESNMKLASGFCPVADLLKAGVNVAIGTDGAASNNNLDMLEELRAAALVAKGVSLDATAVNAYQALHMATLGGARLLGLDHEIGSLEPGKSADFIAIDVADIWFHPMHHPISQLVYAATGYQVSDAWIRGKRLLEASQFTSLDVATLTNRVNHWYERIHA